jgi:hypothetical protein
VDILLGTYNGFTDRFDRIEKADQLFGEILGQNRDAQKAWGRVTQGGVQYAAELGVTGQISNANLGILVGHTFEQWGVLPPGPLAERSGKSFCDEPYNTTCYIFLAPGLAGAGRWTDLDAAVRRVRQAAEELATQGDEAGARGRREVADVMEGLGAWRRGNVAEARRLLTPATPHNSSAAGRAMMALAEIELSEGRWDNAIHYAQGQVFTYGRPRALFIQAKAYEGKGDTVKAREAWRHFVAVTRRGDDDLARVREGREALTRLGG